MDPNIDRSWTSFWERLGNVLGGPRRAKMEPRWANLAPRWLQDGHPTQADLGNRFERLFGASWERFRGAPIAQVGLKTAQDDFGMA